MTFSTKRKLLNALRYLTLGLVAMMMLYPLLWLVVGMFRPNHEIFTSAGLIPQNPYNVFDSIREGWMAGGHSLLFYFWNTLQFLIPRVIGQVVSSVLTAYALTRFTFKGKKFFFTLVIITLLMPEVIFRIPMFQLYQRFDLVDTFFPLWLENAFATGSFFTFMLIQFMRGIPKELDEAAKIDGCHSFQTLVLILVPVMKPAIITVGLLTFMWGMNDFLGPQIYLRSASNWSLQQALRLGLQPADTAIVWRNLFAQSVMALLPAIIIFFAMQRYFIDGIASTGSKE
ncbi:MAG: carbohydrate ABC transporter permease [Defluviitaleaceae bacterium]|nr:carbohydrate ABC transporter permease [Defluviitaleaceae bacterium]